MLTATRTVMHKRNGWGRDFVNKVDYVIFEAREDDHGTVEREVSVTKGAWRDLGEPETITVTIEPGDLLNDA